MNTAAIKKTEIVRELALLPDNQLDSVRMYIETILTESKHVKKSNRSLKGIWSNKGFEKIADLEGEFKENRKHLSDVSVMRQF